uniref:Dipeptidase n=1 Tax=Penicillium lilacinoechinulatum TaxID=451136 RepID=A9Q1F0_9EURO|nr:dipeptidase [Penicillium lilacinoechinulatum]
MDTQKETFKEQAARLLAEVPLIDGHNDFPYMIRGWLQNQINGQESTIRDMPIGQTDILRLKAGSVGAQFWSAFVPCPKPEEQEQGCVVQLHKTIQQIDIIHRLIDAFPETLVFADSAASIIEGFRSGRIASLIGVEGLHQIGNSFSALRMFHRLGVRYVTLTHNCHNVFADAAVNSAQTTSFWPVQERRKASQRNESYWNASHILDLTRIIDLSHTSHAVQEKVLRISEAPVIYSHSSSYTLCPHPRNVTYDNLRLLQDNGGIIMICFLRELTDTKPDSGATLSRVIDHIIDVGKMIGYSHVGIGSDFDGMLRGPDGLEDVTQYPSLVEGMLSRGIAEDDVKNVMGLNLIRVMGEVEKVSEKMKAETKESLGDDIGEIWSDDIKLQLLDERKRCQSLAR